MKLIHKYTLDDDTVKNIRMLARFEVHKETDPDYPSHSVIWKEEVRRRIADTVLRIIVEQEKKKLLK
jgi:hypothetical protein